MVQTGLNSTIGTIEPSLILLEETVPGGAYWSGVIKRGNTLRIIDREGSQGVALICYNADNPVERLNVADTAKIQFDAFLKKGMVVYSDRGRVLFSITEDTSGSHDLLTGCSNAAGNEAKYGDRTLKNSRDNFLKALTRWNLGKPDLMPNLNLFTRILAEPDGKLSFAEGQEKPGSFIDLRAEMNVLVAISNCPHVLHSSSTYDPKPVQLQLWKSPPAASDDLCRNANPEVIRGFINTDALFVQ